MKLFKNIFSSKGQPLKSYDDFWAWFQKNEKDFFYLVKNRKDIEKGFFNKLAVKLNEIKEGYFYLTGMYDDYTVELVLTADGNAKNIVFVEELVAAAPQIAGWKFTALKPALHIRDVGIEMNGYTFNSDNLYFFANEYDAYPDEIDVTIVHQDLTEDNKMEITNGIYIFLDNYLGELEFVNNIDRLTTIGKNETVKELIPIEKLKDYLTWRQKEFIEKYEEIRYYTEKDNYAIFEATLENGHSLIAVMNTELLKWDSKASHPWFAVLTFKYDGTPNNGMPNERDYQLLNSIEDDLMQELKDFDGFLNIGRQTAEGERKIYFACKDFRNPSKMFFNIEKQYSNSFRIDYDIYKDKYWQTVERFINN